MFCLTEQTHNDKVFVKHIKIKTMSHLRRRYTDYYYVEVEKKDFFGRKKRVLEKVHYNYMSEKALQAYEKAHGVSIPRECPNAIFLCLHEERGFIPKRAKRRNHTHARMKRRNKARIRARKAK